MPSSSNISVRTAPTASAFTRMPFGVHAAANDAVRLFTAAFDAPYGAPIGNANMLEPDEMFTIAPLPCANIGSAASRDRNQTLPRLRSTTWCHSSGVHAAIGFVVAAARVVDEDVEAPELVHRSVDQPLTLVDLGDVRRDDQRPAPERLDVPRRLLQRFGPATGEHDVGTVFGQDERDAAPDAGPRTRDHCDAVVQAEP